MYARISRYIARCYRVFKITRKPTREEYKMIVKMSGIGIAAIGILGFVITFLRQVLFPT